MIPRLPKIDPFEVDYLAPCEDGHPDALWTGRRQMGATSEVARVETTCCGVCLWMSGEAVA